jgi:LuxR family transcriptional regulator, maltose regulon positive regulatory protein
MAGTTAPGRQTPGSALLATKLYVPHAPAMLVARPRLLARLDAGLRCPLTLIAAPAGSGKTALLTHWLSSAGSAARQAQASPARDGDRPAPHAALCSSWLSLDERDQDVQQFLRYLIAALQRFAPSCGQNALAELDTAASPQGLEGVLIALVNDLAALSGPCVLVLDDYHLVREPAIHAALGFLLDHLPSACHLVLAAREDPPLPLPRLRARGQLVELRAADLRFSLEEATEFFVATMGTRVCEGQVAALVTRTEGWAAGLQLAALALRDRVDSQGFVATFAGNHRLVADYLSAEVIDRQPTPLRRFLLATSVLERLCAPLCDFLLAADEALPLSEPAAGDGQEMLEAIERANLFLVPLDDERRWYRYHHLFAELLRQRLRREAGPERVHQLYRRARQWHEHHNLPEEAISYALAGQDWAGAARIMEQLSTSLWTSSQQALKWIHSLPEDQVARSPDLCIWYAGLLIMRGEFDQVASLLDLAERTLRARGQRSQLAGVYSYRALVGFLRDDAQPTLENARRAMDYFDDENRFAQAAVIERLARGYFLKGELDEAERVWAETLSLAQAEDGQRTMLFVRAAHGEVQRARGKLRQAAQLDHELLRLIGERPADIIKIRALGRLAGLYYEWNQLEQAERYARQSLELAAQTGREVFACAAYLALTRIHWARGDLALPALERADAVAQRLGGERSAIEVAACQVSLWLAQAAQPASVGQGLAAAHAWATAQRLDLDGELPYEGQPTQLALCRVFIAQQRPDQALRLLERLLAPAEAAGRMRELVEMLALKALAHQAHYQTNQALAALVQALALAEPEGYVRTFVDEGLPMARLLAELRQRPSAISKTYLETLLAAFPDLGSPIANAPFAREAIQGPQATFQALVEPLSKRELEILALMAAGMTNSEIAQQIFISAETVKVHTRNIYGKLEVNGRKQAVAKARALGLLA